MQEEQTQWELKDRARRAQWDAQLGESNQSEDDCSRTPAMGSTAAHAKGDSVSQAIGKQDFQQFLDQMAARAIEGCDFQPGEFEDAEEASVRS